MTEFLCGDCDHVTSEPSTTGPIKEVDEDGLLQRNWAHLCPECFSTNIRPYEPDEVDIGIGTLVRPSSKDEAAVDALFKDDDT